MGLTKKLNIMIVFGTRPEAVKMCPLVNHLKEYKRFKVNVCVTAQHREMLDQVLELFDIVPDFDLDIMKNKQGLTDITVGALEGLDHIFKTEQPNLVLVHGDTTTTFSASLAAFYNKIDLGHVEAGLRTFNKYFPYPEEINRKLTGAISNLHFAPTQTNRENLENEGIDPSKIFISGNTVIDALKTTVKSDYKFENQTCQQIDFSRRVLAVTAHRRENLGNPLENICNALKKLADKYNDIDIVYPVHLNPAVKDTAYSILDGHPRIHLTNPLDLQDMHNLMDKCHMVLTDSGGLQEEAPFLGKPVLVLRNETERPEAVKAGTVKLAGTEEDKIFEMASSLLDNSEKYDKMARAVNPYGDGRASFRIAQFLLHHYDYTQREPLQFKPR